jgi:hypothetical protein
MVVVIGIPSQTAKLANFIHYFQGTIFHLSLGKIPPLGKTGRIAVNLENKINPQPDHFCFGFPDTAFYQHFQT